MNKPNITPQVREWTGTFGREYTDRNVSSVEEMEKMYKENFGISRTDMNHHFLDGMDRSMRILEIGCNVGNQLLCLQKMGFSNLYGIDVQDYAVELAKLRTQNINIIYGSIFDIPYKDAYFDLVFTSAVLIHIRPDDIESAMSEIVRSTRQYIFGYEYYADEYAEVFYRDHSQLLWKANYARLYRGFFPNLELMKEERFKYRIDSNIDSMFLLQKGSG